MSRDLLYTRRYVCLYDHMPFEVYLLYATVRDRIEHTHELLDFSYFKRSDRPGEPFIDYLWLEVKVCPGCCFASSDPAHFDSGNPYVHTFEPDEIVRRRVIESTPARKGLVVNAPGLFGKMRTLEEALLSMKLGIQSSSVLFSCSTQHAGVEIVRAANYALKAAHLCEQAKRESDRDTWYRVALGYLMRSLETNLKGRALAKSLYQLGALGLVSGDRKTASRAYEELRKLDLHGDSRDGHIYFQRFRKLWQSRAEWGILPE